MENMYLVISQSFAVEEGIKNLCTSWQPKVHCLPFSSFFTQCLFLMNSITYGSLDFPVSAKIYNFTAIMELNLYLE